MDGSEIKLFRSLASIPSPSGRERGVAEFIRKELGAMKIPSIIDGAGRKNGSDTGNLVATLEGEKDLTIMFTSHMDTVAEDMTRPKLVERNGILRSANNAIMGADAKAGTAALISALGYLRKKSHPTIIAAFTTREEEGMMGAKLLSIKRRVDYAFVIDDEGKVGSFAARALGYLPFAVSFKGRAAHAATEPEKGRNAIAAAALFVRSLKIGKNSRGETLNIGTISGGTKDNVVPADAVVTGEVRAFEIGGIERQMKHVREAAEKAGASTGCSYTVAEKKNAGSYPFNSTGGRIAEIARKAAVKAGIGFELRDMYATCEANFLCEKGYNTIVMRPGYRNPHSTSESISVSEIRNCRNLIISISEIVSGIAAGSSQK